MKKLLTRFLALMLVVCCCSACVTACTRTEDETYSVTYAAGDGVGDVPKAERYKEGETFKLKGNDVFSRNGYIFVGWNDGTKTLEAGSNYTMPAKDVVFTAQWMQQSIEGKWSGCSLDGKDFLGVEGVSFDITATVKKDGDSAVYVVLSLTGSLKSEDNTNGPNVEDGDNDTDDDQADPVTNELDANDANEDNEGDEAREITMSAALRLPKDENGKYTAEGCTVELINSKLTISIGFGSTDLQKLEFDSWAALGTAPAVSGSYTATGENGYEHTITFGESPSYVVKYNMEGPLDQPEGENGGAEDDTIGEAEYNGEGANNIELYDLDQMDDAEEDGNGDVTDPTEGNGEEDESNPDTGDDNIMVYDVDKIVDVGEYLIIFVNESYQEETHSVAILVLYAGEDNALIANTGEGERLIFTKLQTA